MKRKKLVALIIFGAMMFSGSNVIAAQNSNTDSLDIEKAAIEEINNSESVKTYDKQADLAYKQYQAAQGAARSALNNARTPQAVEQGVVGPIEAENTFNQFTEGKDVNRETVRLDGYNKYISLLKANYNVNVEKQLMDNLEQDYKKAQLQLNNGLISKNDARQVEINYEKAVYQYNSFQKSLESAYLAINNATGVDLQTRYTTLIDNNIKPASKIESLDDYVSSALTNRAEIVNAQNTLDALKKEFQYEQAMLSTDYEFTIQKKQNDIDNAQNSLDESKVKIQIEITNGYKDLQSKMNAVESQQANFNLADSNYKAAQTQYNNSMITLNDFEEVEDSRAQAQMNLKNAELDAWLAQIKMESASGVGPGLN